MDCVIVAATVALREDLVSEDRVILSHREELEKKYDIRIHNHQNMQQP